MTERERLIELIEAGTRIAYDRSLEDVKRIVKENHHFNSATDRTVSVSEMVADYLLENGVIVMPVKIGEVVYEIYDDEIIEARINRIDIYEDVVDIYTQTEIFDDFDDDDWFSLTDIGKTLFITREEAEKALKESEDNG